jgi:hypothetical protein
MLWWRRARVSHVQLTQEPFRNSQQGRHVHIIQCVVAGSTLAVATVHLESEARNSAARLAQLELALGQLKGLGMPYVLAGDTNLGKKDDAILARDKAKMQGASDGQRFVEQSECYCACLRFTPRLTSSSSSPTAAWVSIGSPPHLSSTWDTVRNLSARHLVQGSFAAACRFDRMIFPAHLLRCTDMQLALLDVITAAGDDDCPVQLHASDHWGLFATFAFV